MCFSTICTVKLLYFIWTGASSCLNPYLSLHMRMIGIPIWECVILSSTIPIVQIFMCLIASAVPKYSSSFKKSTLWSLLFTAISGLLLVFTPPIPKPSEKHISMHFQCGPEIEPGIMVDKCGSHCENDERLGEGIEAFFTECHVDCPDKSGHFKNTADLCFAHEHGRVCHVVEVNNTLSQKFTFGIHLEKGIDFRNSECLHSMKSVTWHDNYFQFITCPIILKDSVEKCALKCDMQEVHNLGKYSLSGMKNCLQNSHESIQFAIWLYVGLRLIFHMCLGISTVLIESAMRFTVNIERSNPKRFTLYSHLSAAVFTPLAGLVIDNNKSADMLFNYKLLFVFFFGFVMLSIVLLGSLDIDCATLPSPMKVISHLPNLLRKPDVSTILIVLFALGNITGFMDTFLFWHLEDQTAPHYVMGLSSTLALLIGLPFLNREVRTFVRKLDAGSLLTICFAFQCIRCLGYFLSRNFWWYLLIEMTEACSFSFLWCAISGYLPLIKPEDSSRALQNMTGIVHYGFGKAVGILAGGISMITFGFYKVFLGFGIFSATVGTIYFLLHQTIFKKTVKDMVNCDNRVTSENASALLTPQTAINLTEADSARETFLTGTTDESTNHVV